VCHVKGGVAGRLVDGSAICPENVRYHSRPPRDVTLTGFDKGFADGAMLAFDDPVGTRVVS
jgi:hypothetical protein